MKQKELEKYMPSFLENGDVECYAHPFTLGTYEKMTGNLELFRRCVREVYDGFHQNNYLYFMLSKYDNYDDPYGRIYAVDKEGKLTYSFFDLVRNYLRIELHPEYDPNSKVVKSCDDKLMIMKANNDGSVTEKIVNTAPSVKFGGYSYIWTNKQQCLDGTEKTMALAGYTVHDALSQVVLSNPNVKTPLLSKLLQRECTKIALERCDEEELKLLKRGTLSRADNYKNWKEIASLEKKNESEKFYNENETFEQIDFFDQVEGDEINK